MNKTEVAFKGNLLFQRMADVSLIISLLTCTGFVLSIIGAVDVQPIVFVLPSLAYPIIRTNVNQKSRIRDLSFLVVFCITFGSLLSVAEMHPLGFADAYKHSIAWQHSIQGGNLNIIPSNSLGFIGLYIISDVVMTVLSISVHNTVSLIPVITFSLLGLGFYLFSSYFLQSEWNLFSTIIFLTSWGIFRFAVEYRTLNMALPVGMLLLYTIHSSMKMRSSSLIALLLGIMMVFSHLTTSIFILLIMSLHTITQREKSHIIVAGVLSMMVFSYAQYLSSTFLGAVGLIIEQSLSFEVLSQSSGGNTQGLVGRTYGDNVFAIQWGLRILFITSFVSFSHRLLTRRNRDDLFMFVSSVVLGGILLLFTVSEFILNPGRVFTFFSITYAITFAAGIVHIENFARKNVSKIARGVVIFILVTSILITAVKFPQNIIGETEPIRPEEPVDDLAYYEVDEHHVSSRTHIHSYLTGGYHPTTSKIRFDFGPGSNTIRLFYLGPDRLETTFATQRRDLTHTYFVSNKEEDGLQDRIYSSGKIHVLSENTGRNYTARQQSLSSGASLRYKEVVAISAHAARRPHQGDIGRRQPRRLEE